ncbi:MAG: murein transglycosylase [Cyanobacteria bacterium QS_7_48_42]|jgi:membrane-bound lytic murein transglycosylase A|nr:MAG: murein transglycosylase [Cyanobacteria bacterium QH_10_48_56]PSO63224.1 MAG: murein transglycosylase [Cyanobacteria bacterium QH_2_48_84]PSO71525.1 MAG: murein transglycosylase [Cyanobacteria bacterium QS_1_48_34]PSO77913.1 MAG: murein transglycosylase [Cyanobacteria bacterium QH_3_48_40]PSO93029.1 MAG: murein transglycosylase [Cyanobacteria bacterium QS_9_48_30]PSO95832.1 MAG: murein transglycosylase [Cyanobacteria bacterium SW_6_48_11]PSP06362.1 MAG: murein transglycosylase [Cyanoba
MKKIAFVLSLGLGIALSNLSLPAVGSVPLRKVEIDQLGKLGIDKQLWGVNGEPADRKALLQAIDRSLRYLNTQSAAKAYRDYPVSGVTRDRVRRSLKRFRELLVSSESPAELQAAVEREFALYQAAGQDDKGTVHFTGYFEPVYAASQVPTEEFRYPLYRLPPDFEQWSKPHPTRAELVGKDGLLGKESPIAGNELVWLRDRFKAFLVHVQGSATLRLRDGSTMTVGYAGKTDYPYTSIGGELVEDGKLPREGLTLQTLIDYFRDHPSELDQYLPRNQSFVFFREIHKAHPIGSLNLPVTAERSIATDKSLMPPGALALIRTQIPDFDQAGELETPRVSRYVLDQDTGSAIEGAGRVDIFMGTGSQAGDRAGVIDWNGKLYYLLLKK